MHPGWNRFTGSCTEELIERFCARDDLATFDPYDIWKTGVGFRIKDFYNRHPRAGLPPAAAAAAFDGFMNNRRRLFYRRQEYPIVRAMAALCLVNLYRKRGERRLMEFAGRHLEWLVAHSSRGYHGHCWGLGFPYAVSAGVVYDANMPLSTMTPYALEAFLAVREASGSRQFDTVIGGILSFLERDLCVMEEDEEALATSYAPLRDRIVINAVSYTMYSYALLLPFAPAERRPAVERKIGKLYRYVRRHQRADGSWFYSPRGRSFIDCFHSCIVLKNLIKTGRLVPLEGAAAAIQDGYAYLLRALLDRRSGLFRRFAVRNKAGLARFDLYDNAEALNLALLMEDSATAARLLPAIWKRFVVGPDVYSQIDVLGVRRNKNTLRWAVMPLLYALSQTLE